MEPKEISDIIISWVALSIAFMFLLSGITISNIASSAGKITLGLLAMYLFIVAVSFLSHEFGHRQVARVYGFKANYEMWPMGLMLAIFSSLFGILIAAPGAVVIRQAGAFLGGRKKLKDISLKISIAGIAINIFLGVVFLVLFMVTGIETLVNAASINIILALFNLLPVSPLDGSKVFYYNRKVWLAAFVISLVLFFII